MSDTDIEWAQKVWNPMTGCSRIGAGCQNCYAVRMAKRLRGRCGYPADDPFRVTLHPDRLDQPRRWRSPRWIFVDSMGDLFHDDVPDSFIWDVFDVMRTTPRHVYIVLTKRIARAQRMMPSRNRAKDSNWPLRNVILGVSVSHQYEADRDIPLLAKTTAAWRAVSMEPLLGPIVLNADLLQNLDWGIVGGETGPRARPVHPNCVRGLRDQFVSANKPFFFKQWGEWSCKHIDFSKSQNFVGPDGTYGELALGFGREHPGSEVVWRVGKRIAGRILDGRKWDQFPAVMGAESDEGVNSEHG